MRPALVLIHRYVGLFIAGFLFVSGLTGAVISWDHELDDLPNPQLMEATGVGPGQDPLQLAKAVEARDPRVKVTFVPLNPQRGTSLEIGVDPKVDPGTGKLFEPGYNQVFLDPVTGRELGRREWGGVWPINRENLVSFLYVLHYSLHIPQMWGTDRMGLWLLGGIAILWMLDSFIGFYLTMPATRRVSEATARDRLRRWLPAWKVRWMSGSRKLNLDLHRAFSLWTWMLLFIPAFTAFSMNLYDEVFYPVRSRISKVTPSPFDLREPTAIDKPLAAQLDYREIVRLARAESAARGWAEPAGSVFYTPNFGIYGVSFFKPGDDHGAAGVGPPVLYFDGQNGRLLGTHQPWEGTAADLFVQAQFPLHSGRILGLPGRIFISFMGLVVAMLSVTGVILWWRKRSGRSHVRLLSAAHRDMNLIAMSERAD